jgi:hypothetical protein
MTKSNKLFFITVGTGVVTALFVMHRLNERRVQALEHEIRVAMDRQAGLTDEAAESARREAAALAASLTAASRMPAVAAAPASQPAGEAEPTAADGPKGADATKKPEITPEVRAARVASTFSQQAADPIWAHEAEKSIGKALAQSVGTSSLESLECKTTMCKARFRHDDSEKFNAFLDKFVGSSVALWKGEIYSYRDETGPDGIVRNSIYFWKEGESSTL